MHSVTMAVALRLQTYIVLCHMYLSEDIADVSGEGQLHKYLTYGTVDIYYIYYLHYYKSYVRSFRDIYSKYTPAHSFNCTPCE